MIFPFLDSLFAQLYEVYSYEDPPEGGSGLGEERRQHHDQHQNRCADALVINERPGLLPAQTQT